MDRRTVRVAVVAALCIVALSAAAATLDTATTSGGGFGPSNADGGGLSDSEGGSPLGFDDRGDDPVFAGDRPLWSGCLTFLRTPEFFAGVALVAVAVGVVLSRRRDPLYAVLFLAAWGFPLSLVYLFLATCPDGSGQEIGLLSGDANNSSIPSGGGLFGQASGSSPAPPSVLVLVVLAGVLLVAVAAIVLNTGDDDRTRPSAPDEDEPDTDRVTAIGRVAGAAADRIDAQGDVDNEVYRAWREMAALLPVENPRATTPREFADAAIDAGLHPDDVDELTDLFESVRYGGLDATTERERRAVAALRNVESTYTDGDGWSSDRDRP